MLSSTKKGRVDEDSNRGWGVSLAAPGKAVLSTVSDSRFRDLEIGTSQATAAVSGAACPMLQAAGRAFTAFRDKK